MYMDYLPYNVVVVTMGCKLLLLLLLLSFRGTQPSGREFSNCALEGGEADGQGWSNNQQQKLIMYCNLFWYTYAVVGNEFSCRIIIIIIIILPKFHIHNYTKFENFCSTAAACPLLCSPSSLPRVVCQAASNKYLIHRVILDLLCLQ